GPRDPRAPRAPTARPDCGDRLAPPARRHPRAASMRITPVVLLLLGESLLLLLEPPEVRSPRRSAAARRVASADEDRAVRAQALAARNLAQVRQVRQLAAADLEAEDLRDHVPLGHSD